MKIGTTDAFASKASSLKNQCMGQASHFHPSSGIRSQSEDWVTETCIEGLHYLPILVCCFIDNLYFSLHTYLVTTSRPSYGRSWPSTFNELLWWLVTSTIVVRCWRLITKQIAELLGSYCDIRPFYASCHFDELSRASDLCLLNTSFGTAISQCHNSIFWAEINHHGSLRGDTGRILARWQRPKAQGSPRPVVLGDALGIAPMHCHDHQIGSWMRCIFSVVNFNSCIIVAEQPWYGQLKINPTYTIVHYYVFI